MATIRDVAARAGVSPATVSRVTNGRAQVSAVTRQRVAEAVAALGYVPDVVARSLKMRATGLVGLLIPEIVDPFYVEVAQGAEQAANELGLRLLLGTTGINPERERAYLDLVLAQQVDGVVFAAMESGRAPLAALRASGLPAVLLDEIPVGEAIDSVRCDNVGGAAALTRHLVDHGHTRFAVINGRRETTAARERLLGVRRGLAEAGIVLDDDLVSHGTWGADDAEARTAALLNGPPFTAVLALGAFTAAGVCRALRAADRRVPGDVAVAAFDDVPWAAEIDPFLTAAAQPSAEIGAAAIRLLAERIAGFDGPPRELLLPVAVIVRRSSGGPVATD
jgi:LacI family transcriptional regulator